MATIKPTTREAPVGVPRNIVLEINDCYRNKFGGFIVN